MNMPPVTKNIIIINVLMFVATYALQKHGVDFESLLGLHFFLADDFRPWQLLTYMFMHAGLQHIFFNMFAVWMFGRVMESVWGSRRFLFFYLFCGIGAGFCQEIAQYAVYMIRDLGAYEMVNTSYGMMSMGEYLNYWNTVGASGAIYGILLAFGMTFPDERMFIFPLPVPIKAKYFVMGYAAIEIFSVLAVNVSDNVAHMAHLGGMLFGFILLRYWRAHEGGALSSSNNLEQLLDRFSQWFQQMKSSFSNSSKGSKTTGNEGGTDKEKEMDRILEKVRKKGYGSLTDEEKRKLFNR